MKIRIALVGLNFGSNWVSVYKEHPNVEYVGLCDTNQEVLAHVADQHQIERRHTKLEQILESNEYDAVHLFTPIPLHAEHAISVLSSNKHCACAIPMAINMGDIHRIIEAQRKSGKNYMLMETEVYSPTFLLANKLYENGEFGELQLLRGVHYQNMEGWPVYWMGLPPMYYCYHGLGPVLYLIDKMVTNVVCFGSGVLPEEMQNNYGNPFPVESALLQLEDSNVTCEVSVCMFKMVRDFLVDRFYIYGDRLGFESAQIGGEKPVIFEAQQGELSPEQRGRGVTRREVVVPDVSEYVTGEFVEYAHKSRFKRGVLIAHEFIRSIIEGRPSAIDTFKSANWTATGLCAHDSAMRNGEKIAVPRFD